MSDNNQLIVVTGGSKGIGKEINLLFGAHGFDVATCARDPKHLDALKAEWPEDNGQLFTLPADLSDETDTKSFVDAILKLERPIDVLVNNAGRFIPGLVHEEAEGILETIIATNLYSAYRISRGLIPGMKAQQKGHIFNICSVASLKAYENGGSYSISKFAMLGLSKSLREELKTHGIRVTSVMPGATYTPSWEETTVPEERFIPARDVAEMIYHSFMLDRRTVIEDIVIRPQLGDL